MHEIRTREEENNFRVAYVAKFGDDVAVLQCWQKKQTAESDKKTIVKRYREYQER